MSTSEQPGQEQINGVPASVTSALRQLVTLYRAYRHQLKGDRPKFLQAVQEMAKVPAPISAQLANTQPPGSLLAKAVRLQPYLAAAYLLARERERSLIAAVSRLLPKDIRQEDDSDEEPIALVLSCEKCHTQHIDFPDPDKSWLNPPHKTHRCAACGWQWRPCDKPTIGVPATFTHGEHDNMYALPDGTYGPKAAIAEKE